MARYLSAWALVVGLAAVALSQNANVAWEARHGLTSAEYQDTFDALNAKGYRPVCVSGYAGGGEVRYAGIWEKRGGSAWEARHGLNPVQYQDTFDDLNRKGYRPILVNGYAVGDDARYAAIWEKSDGPAWEARHGLTSARYQDTFDDLNAKGYRPIWVSGYTVAGEARFAAIWEKRDGAAWVARHGLTSAQYQDTFDDLNAKGYRPICVSGYAVGGEARYAAIWEKRDGAWEARHGLSAAQYQETFDALNRKGYKPVCVNGYLVGGEARYAAIWEKTP